MRITSRQLRRIIREELLREAGFGDVKMAEFRDEQIEKQMKEIEAGNLPDNLAQDLGAALFIADVRRAEAGVRQEELRDRFVKFEFTRTYGDELGEKLYQSILVDKKRAPADLDAERDRINTERGRAVAKRAAASGDLSHKTWNDFKDQVRNELRAGKDFDTVSIDLDFASH